MKCSNVIVPGFEQTNKIKNPGLETKIERDISEAQKLAKRKIKRNFLMAKAGKFDKYPAGELSARNDKAIEGMYRPYTHLEQEIVRREELRGDAAVQRWFRNLREKVALGEMTEEQRKDILKERIDRHRKRYY